MRLMGMHELAEFLGPARDEGSINFAPTTVNGKVVTSAYDMGDGTIVLVMNKESSAAMATSTLLSYLQSAVEEYSIASQPIMLDDEVLTSAGIENGRLTMSSRSELPIPMSTSSLIGYLNAVIDHHPMNKDLPVHVNGKKLVNAVVVYGRVIFETAK